MTTAFPSTTSSSAGPNELTLAMLRRQNQIFRGSGGVSVGNRSQGFRPAFYDMDTGIVYPSRFASGLEAPMHLLDGLPDDLVVSRLANGRVEAVKPGIVAGFVRHGQFFTRQQAAMATAPPENPAGRFSNPRDHRRLLSAWERFVENREVGGDEIRPVVEASWQRCHAGQVDPERRQAPLVADAQALDRHRDRQAALREAAQPVLARAGELLFEEDSLVLLADPEGLVLDVAGDRRTRAQAEKVNLMAGGLWSERDVGTNAIGTALTAAEPVQLYGAEHFCTGIKPYTCSADVIRDPHDGRVLGVIDLSGRTCSHRPHALDFAMSAARMIEANLMADYFHCRDRVIEASRDAFRRWPGEGLLAFDRRGRLVKASTPAHDALQRLGADLALTPQTRLPSLDRESPGEPQAPPPWLVSQERQALGAPDREVGTLVRLSARS
ncbi:sigma-54-dependent Fis family transcriptional regulator [Halomonas sp. M4R1S46]|uniref:sigma-54-dependent Fis family transcriptional regulator n=1 Tax=Halomonas sp. M4R1S46 TaxID=2982692 RepID=UPI0021E36339|nr:GAF domain-containing protein [Halomonas sp. M4R1S46]UYG06965.1 GAF domain-containing protein [Halomonas sp. M4R1S46]